MRQRISIASRLLLPALLLLVLTGMAQDFQIRTRVDLVVVPVTVKASGDRLVTSLTKDDFIILENGQPQAITNFTTDPVPLSAAVLVDTGLSPDSLAKVQQSFPALAGAFSEFDEVSVYRFDKFIARVLDFSRDLVITEAALKTLKDVKPNSSVYPANTRGPFSTPGPVINGAAVVPAGQLGVFVTMPPENSKVLHDAIFDAAGELAKREPERRRIVLVITDGITRGNDRSYDETVQRLLDAGIQVYAVGLDQTPLTKIASVLSNYAKATGGDTYFAGSIQNLESSYARAAEQARNQYVLGYVSSNAVRGQDPVFREIEVKVVRGDFEVLHRKGYYQHP